MGKFYVTMHDDLYIYTCNQKGMDVSSTLFGPLFVYTEKSYESCHYYFSTLLKLELRLAIIIAVGTDGESVITKALKTILGKTAI